MLKIFNNYKVLLIIAALCGILTAVFAVNQWNKIAGMQEVMVAAVDIETPGKEVNTKQVTLEAKSKSDLPADVVTSLTELEGKAPRGLITKGTVLRQSMFKPVEQFGAEGLLAQQYSDRQAFAFELNMDTTVGGQVDSGSLVNIHAIMKSSPNKEYDKQVVAQKVPVLMIAEPSSANGNTGSVVLALTDQEIEKIKNAYAQSAMFKFTLLPR